MSGTLTAPFYDENDKTQRKYEMLRAHFVDMLSVNEATKLFEYSVPRFWQIWTRFKDERLAGLFDKKKGPKRQWKVSSEIRDTILRNRKAGMNIMENKKALASEGIALSHNTIWKILRKEGYGKKPKGKNNGREIVTGKHTFCNIDGVQDRSIQTKFAGLFFLIPYMRLLGIEKWGVDSGPKPTVDFPTLKTNLTILNLKCIGAKRFAHIGDYVDDLGIAIAAGLNRLPGKTTIHEKIKTYTWKSMEGILKGCAGNLIGLKIVSGDLVNMDIHNIPYWGEDEPLSKEYIPTRGKGMRAVKSIIVQDQKSTFPFWTTTRRADLSADRATLYVADVCDELFGKKQRKFVFDCTTATYRALNKLNTRGVLFITLRRRCESLKKEIEAIPKENFKTVRINIPKRVHQKLQCTEMSVKLPEYRGKIRQIAVTNTGHNDDYVVVITNDKKIPVKQLLEEYAWRWRVENNISENVDFFSLNSLPGYIEVKADVNVVFTLVADQIYKLFAKDIPNHEKCKPETLFRKFIHKSGTIEITQDAVVVTFSYFNGQELLAPLFRNLDKLLARYSLGPHVPWLGNRRLIFRFS